MAIGVSCPDCFQKYSVKDELVGKKIRCKACQCVIQIEAPANELDELEDVDDEPVPDSSRARSSKGTKVARQTSEKKKSSKPSASSGIPWLGVGIPLGSAIALYLASKFLPYGVLKLGSLLLAMLTLTGCGAVGFYMLARVSARLGSDVQYGHLRAARKIAGKEAAIAFASLAIFFVMARGVIQAPLRTLPWLLMTVIGVTGVVGIGYFEKDAFKKPPQQYSPPGWDDKSWADFEASKPSPR